MDRRFLVVLGMSLVFALIVSIVFYQLVAARTPERPKVSATKDLVLATRALPLGLTIKASDVKLTKVPTDLFPKGAFSKAEDVVDRPVISNILADEPILEGRLAEKGSGLGLAPIIPVGMRAVAVRVSDVAGVAGFVLPGLRVDVLVTGHPPRSDDMMTTTVLQNILVLSAGQTIQPDARGQAIQTPTVTLLVNPEQAEILTLAGNQGSVQLVLRNSGDQQTKDTPGSGLNGLYRVSPPPPPPRAEAPRVIYRSVLTTPPPAPKPPAPPEVVVIRGNQRSVETVPAKVD